MNEDLIYATLLEVKQQLGGIQQTLVAQGSAFTAHCATDDRDRERVKALELESAKHTGARRAIGWAFTFLISLSGAAAGWFGAKHVL